MYFKTMDKEDPLICKNFRKHDDRYAFFNEKTTSKDMIDIEVCLMGHNNIKSILVIRQT